MPPSAISKRPFLSAIRAGERASLVAEELAFEQGLGQRRAVDGDERAPRPVAVLVNGARRQLLPGAGLAADQDGAVRRRQLADAAVDLAHGGAVADHVVRLQRHAAGQHLREDVAGRIRTPSGCASARSASPTRVVRSSIAPEHRAPEAAAPRLRGQEHQHGIAGADAVAMLQHALSTGMPLTYVPLELPRSRR